MRAAFNDTPDNKPFNSVPNRTSLTLGLATQPPCGPDTPAPQSQSFAAAPSGTVPADKTAVAAKWAAWKAKQQFTGPLARVDSANPEQMNRFSWYEAHDWTKPYPGDTKIYPPDQVPGAYLPSSESDG
jgi:hypothetical protein